MSWRETLGVTPSARAVYTHNAHNTQKPAETANCAYIADSAYRDSEQKSSTLLEALVSACEGQPIDPDQAMAYLSADDLRDFEAGELTLEQLRVYIDAVVERRTRDQGDVPRHYTATTYCRGCGPVWIFEGAPPEVSGCPWCWNRANGRQIPRPPDPVPFSPATGKGATKSPKGMIPPNDGAASPL